MTVISMIPPEARTAVDRLFELASSDTGQARRAANFLLAWHNGADWGGFDIADLFAIDRAVAADMATLFAFLGQHGGAIYPEAFGHQSSIERILYQWRDLGSDEE
ncbi:MAG: hypothetical protein JHC57_07990 [Sphingopyxis sp.]|uniref:DUF7673 family protein n=1 Tax=Sphingopyxis sp. TaxID=1908224 RepID=UPI001A28F307|nr:hypothetical protein [Sphingopyxis sp.]MBJ7499677.1 hypothetical protein [Sphingopyxis sp.]